MLSAAVTIGIVLNILHSAYTIGSESLPAPQASLMKSVVEGVFNKNLPWNWIIIGILIGFLIIFIDLIQEKRNSNFRFPVLAVAVGLVSNNSLQNEAKQTESLKEADSIFINSCKLKIVVV